MFSMGNKANVIKLRYFRIKTMKRMKDMKIDFPVYIFRALHGLHGKIIATINRPTGHKVIRSARGIALFFWFKKYRRKNRSRSIPQQETARSSRHRPWRSQWFCSRPDA